MNGYRITPEEQRELFGDSFDDHAAEAEERWGSSEAWQQSQQRATTYSKEQWQEIKEETDETNARFVALMQSGVPATSTQAMDGAEDVRRQICRWFYDCPREMHAGIAELYVSDPRYTQTYEQVATGLARYVHDAVVANAARG